MLLICFLYPHFNRRPVLCALLQMERKQTLWTKVQKKHQFLPFCSLVSLILLIAPSPISSTVDAFLPSSPPPLALLSFCLSRTHSSEPFFTLQMAIVLLHSSSIHTHTCEHMRLHSLSVTMTLSAPHSQLDLL